MVRCSSRIMINKFSILYEDAYLIAINKPHNLLSVPGLSAVVNVFSNSLPYQQDEIMDRSTIAHSKCSRSERWMKAVLTVSIDNSQDDNIREIFQSLSLKSSLPRKHQEFVRYLSRDLKLNDPCIQDKVWNLLNNSDMTLQKEFSPGSDIPSAASIVEELINGKVYPVHRLDLETSGVLLFAKTSHAAGDLSCQFRDKSIKKIYIARVVGTLDKPNLVISLPLRSDKLQKPMQVVDLINGKVTNLHSLNI